MTAQSTSTRVPEATTGSRVSTNPTSVQVFTRDMVLEGNMHAKPGYKGRVSDLLNGPSRFLALTEATLWKRDGFAKIGTPVESSTAMVSVEDIEVLLALE